MYSELLKYAESGDYGYEFEKMYNSLRMLLDIRTLEEFNEKIKYFYIKDPFGKSEVKDIEKEIFAFTSRNSIIELKTITEGRFLKDVEIQIYKLSDIDTVKLVSNVNNIDVRLEINFKSSKSLVFCSDDINDAWKYKNAEQIESITKYLVSIL